MTCHCGWQLPSHIELRFTAPVDEVPVVIVTCPVCDCEAVQHEPEGELVLERVS